MPPSLHRRHPLGGSALPPSAPAFWLGLSSQHTCSDPLARRAPRAARIRLHWLPIVLTTPSPLSHRPPEPPGRRLGLARRARYRGGAPQVTTAACATTSAPSPLASRPCIAQDKILTTFTRTHIHTNARETKSNKVRACGKISVPQERMPACATASAIAARIAGMLNA